nr:Chain A, cortexillin I/GCN4 hybrid peptide [synthetic construct]
MDQLNALLASLEAENKQLKAKVEELLAKVGE